MRILTVVLFIAVSGLAFARDKVKTIHVLVALCDNKHQGIVPVSAALGNGADPQNNLYWGAQYGVRTFLRKSVNWQHVTDLKTPEQHVLTRTIFRHKTKDIYLVADAWDGKTIRNTLTRFLESAAGQGPRLLPTKSGDREMFLKLYGSADLLVFVGHNGLMDFDINPVSAKTTALKDAMVFCCKSSQYFDERLQHSGAKPLVTTRGLMAPEGYVLHAAIGAWAGGQSANDMRMAAAKAYATYQRCRISAAKRLFGCKR